MVKITIYNEDRRFIDRITGDNLFIKIIDGIQCICKDTGNSVIDSYSIIYTLPKNFFIIKETENE
ncbi:hypothetical protein HMPREF9700_01841 [Bergeyella zoohelcum CCUG 30536]|uniref:Uncharacterized protein n=1 Tax=Bergeyella zoohelcum TaxID=1015 RepID=A0A380ZZZ3_9FLAO|nr:hypothetical protein HMPREF9700_01841 [Bergeyella zoohelcum CCUG 30536]SUV53150.1 Uncharacterised protein [Bergeyella zoohelcum]